MDRQTSNLELVLHQFSSSIVLFASTGCDWQAFLMGWILTVVLLVIWATLALFYSRNDLLNGEGESGDLLKEDNLV